MLSFSLPLVEKVALSVIYHLLITLGDGGHAVAIFSVSSVWNKIQEGSFFELDLSL